VQEEESGSGSDSEEWQPLERGSSVEYDDGSDDSGFADLADMEHSSNGSGEEDNSMYVATD
jgi:hypothetical protein